MLKGRLQVLKQVPCDPPRKFFIIDVPRLHLVQFKHNDFFELQFPRGGTKVPGGGGGRMPPPAPT